MDNLTIVIPYYEERQALERTLASLPTTIPTIIVDDHSEQPLQLERENTRVVRPAEKGYFTGAVNVGIMCCKTDVLVLNQDITLTGTAWLDLLANYRSQYALIGERIKGDHPAFPYGYVHGVFQFMRRDAINQVGLMNQELYPLWGASALWQLQICRKGFMSLPLPSIPGLWHQPRNAGDRYGASIVKLLRQNEESKNLFIRTPPLVSVVIPCYNYGRFIADAINSLIGGPTSLGVMAGQTFQSFEVIIVDDGSDLETQTQLAAVTNGWKGIKLIRQTNKGTAGANNSGIKFAIGKYITIQAADDMREPWSLQDLYDAIQQRPHQYVYDAPTYFTKGRRGRVATLQPYDCQALPERNMVPAGIMFPREAWVEAGGYREHMIYGREDWAFNIALAMAGWHGHRIDRSGYLYRREAHNRSLANAELRDLFKLQIEQIFPGINREAGMCCNDKRTYMGKQNGPVAPRTFNAASVPQGMTLVEYIGGNVGSQSWGGPGAVPSNRYYVFGRNPKDQVKYVDTRDVPMLLTLQENDKHLFRVYKPVEQPATQPEPEKLGMGALEVKQDAPVVTLPASIPVPTVAEPATVVEEPATPKKRFDPTKRKAKSEAK